MSGGNGGGNGARSDQSGPLSALGRQDLMNAYLEAEVGYKKTTGATQQHWFDRRVEIAAEFSARFGSWPEPQRSAEDPAARPYLIPTKPSLRSSLSKHTWRVSKAPRRPNTLDARTDLLGSGPQS